MAGPASAQNTFNFHTTGQFGSGASSCDDATDALTVVCTDPTVGSSLTLTFTGEPVNALNYGDGTTVTLGNFMVGGEGEVGAVTPGTVTFTLWIHQVHPTTESMSTMGSITGSIMRDETSANGGLLWSPTEIVWIGPVSYDLIFEEGTDGINISAANNSSVQAVGTVVPEPSTYALMAAGLAGMAVVARRRRRNA